MSPPMPNNDDEAASDAVGDEPPKKMETDAIRKEYREITRLLRNWDGLPVDGYNDVVSRLHDLYSELRHRVDVDLPPCPGCGETDWRQRPNEPVTCGNCNRTPTEETREELWDAHETLVNGDGGGGS